MSTARSLIMVPAWHGQATVDELRERAGSGQRPRTDYVALADELDADVMDMQYLKERAMLPTRLLVRLGKIVPAQILEAFLRRGRYRHVVARADRLGLPLALALKLVRGRRDLVLVSVWLTPFKKSVFLKPLKAHSHLAAIINYSSMQMELARVHLRVPAAKLHHAKQPVDETFFTPRDVPLGDYVVAVGSEQRDYPTLVEAARHLDIDVQVAVGSSILNASGDVAETFAAVRGSVDAPSSNVTVHEQLPPHELRDLYAGARMVVVPLRDVDFDCGVTVIAEAMAMGKAVVVTATRGQVDLVQEGVNGLYVPPGQPAALRAAIQRLLDDPDEAARMGRAGRQLAESELTLDGWVGAVAAVTRGGPAER